MKLFAFWNPTKNIRLSGGNEFNLIIRGGLSYRFLISDLTDEKDLLMDQFGTSQTNFWGFEGDVNLVFNKLHFYFSPLIFINSVDVKAFPQKGIFKVGVIVTGDFLRFDLEKK